MTSIKQVSDSELRGNRKNKSLKSSVEVQLIDFYETHDEDKPKHYQIALFAIDDNSNSYCIKVNGFKPFFYIEMDGFTYEQFEGAFIETPIANKFFDQTIGDMIYDRNTKKHMIEKVKFKKFNGYNPKISTFAKVSFHKLWDFKNVVKHISGDKWRGTKGKGIQIMGRTHNCKLFDNYYVNAQHQFQSKIGNDDITIITEWYDSTKAYEKFYALKITYFHLLI